MVFDCPKVVCKPDILIQSYYLLHTISNIEGFPPLERQGNLVKIKWSGNFFSFSKQLGKVGKHFLNADYSENYKLL